VQTHKITKGVIAACDGGLEKIAKLIPTLAFHIGFLLIVIDLSRVNKDITQSQGKP
jgi:hypothetical protein